MKLTLKPISAEVVLATSAGEVTLDETLSFRTGKPVPGGIMCQRIFGPIKDYCCDCRKYEGKRFQGHTCENCKVTVTSSRSRTERMGHIDVVIPTLNPLILPAIRQIFSVSTENLNLYLSGKLHCRWVGDPKSFLTLKTGEVGRVEFLPLESLDEEDLLTYSKGSIALYQYASNIDLEATINNPGCPELLRTYYDKNFNLVDLFIRYLPVSPAAYRPIAKMDSYYSSHPKNDLYLRVIRRAIRVRRLIEIEAEAAILQEESSLMYKAILNLFVGGSTDGNGHQMPGSLEMLSGKTGLVRSNLLGKRVDWSGRSVITSAGDRVEMDELGVPHKIAYTLLKPFIIKHLLDEYLEFYEEAVSHYDRRSLLALKSLEVVAPQHRLMMNRAPTLHRFGVMAFRIKLVPGKAILVHPLVCSPFNADFDGDTVSLHTPLSPNAKLECEMLMTPKSNLIASLDGEPLINLSHEMVIGLSYLSRMRDEGDFKSTVFNRLEDLESLHQRTAPCGTRPLLEVWDKILWKTKSGEIQETSYGRLLIQDMFQVNTISEELSKKQIKVLVSESYGRLGADRMMVVLDLLMKRCLHTVTSTGFSVGMNDAIIPSTKSGLVAKSEAVEKENHRLYEDGEITSLDRYERNIREWNTTIQQLQKDWMSEAGRDNPIVLMYTTGARVSLSQVSQLNVSKGLISDALNRVIERPIINSLAEGLSTSEYFISCSGSRKSLADKKNLTPKSGYLTRKMITAARDFYIVEEDCGTTDTIRRTRKSSIGRYDSDNYMIFMEGDGEDMVNVRSPLHCKSHNGICVKCYGMDPSSRRIVRLGANVGAIAAHSLTESTTQMTMRTFHTSGAATIKDSPMVIKTAKSGIVEIVREEEFSWIHVKSDFDDFDSPLNHRVTYIVDRRHSRIVVEDGQKVGLDDPLAIYVQSNLSSDDVSGSLPQIEALYEARVPNNMPRAIIAKTSGEVSLSVDENRIVVSVNGEVQGSIDKTPVFVGTGQMVEAGQFLSYGAPSITSFYSETRDLNLTYSVFEQSLMNIYHREGLTPVATHSEMIFRAMSNLVTMKNGHLGLRSHGDQGDILVKGITQVGAKFPSWLKSIAFGWVHQTIVDAAVNLKTTYGLPTERIMQGKLVYEPREVA